MMNRIKIALAVIVIVLGGCDTFNNVINGDQQRVESTIIDNKGFNGAHVSTRPHNRKLIYHKKSKRWYVFYGIGEADSDGKFRIFWKTSKDGANWSQRKVAFEGHSNASSVDVLLQDDLITMLIFRPFFHCENAGIPAVLDGKKWYKRNVPAFPLPYEICHFKIEGENLVRGPVYTAMEGNSHRGFPHYGSLTRDTNGYFWVGARLNSIKEQNPCKAWVARSVSPDDISEWEPVTELFEASGKGTVAVQVIALDSGKVFAVIFSKSDVKIFGSLYDPVIRQWQKPYVIAEGNHYSKRAVACYDDVGKALHLVYVDDKAVLRHKILAFPHQSDNWNPQAGARRNGLIIDKNIGTKPWADNNISLSIDTSAQTANLVAAYHHKTPQYHLKLYDGRRWSENELLLGNRERNRINDEMSMIRNYKDQFGAVYYDYKTKKDPDGILRFIKIEKKRIKALH